MLQKKFFLLFVFYFGIFQFFIISLLWNEPRFALLGGINLIAFFLIAWCYKTFTKEKGEKAENTPLVKEKISNLRYEETPYSREQGEEERAIDTAFPKEEAPLAPLSESNIEYIKSKINRSKKPVLAAGSAQYRFAIFLLALIGFWGVLYMFWETFDFLAMIIGALGMIIFLAVVFKAANLWRKPLFLSGYVLFFLALILLGIYALVAGNENPQLSMLKEQITIFLEGIQPKDPENLELPELNSEEDPDFLFEKTGTVLGLNLSGESQISGEIAQLTGSLETKVEISEEIQPLPLEDPNKELTMLEAIKYVLEKNAIPLSTAKNVKFKYLATTDEDYPYMKTALEKRMIGSTTDPKMPISCDIYMVIKGLAENWTVGATSDVKAAYWELAVAKDVLKGCQKGARLTYGNL